MVKSKHQSYSSKNNKVDKNTPSLKKNTGNTDFMTLKVLYKDSEARVITEGNGDFQYGILLPQNVFYEGGVVAIDVAKEHIRRAVKDKLFCYPLNTVVKDGIKFCFLTTKIKRFENEDRHKEYKENEIYHARIELFFETFYIVKVDDYFEGYLPKEGIKRTYRKGDTLDLRLVRRSLSSLQLSLFSLPDRLSATDKLLSSEEVEAKFLSMFNDVERKAIPETDIQLIKHDISLYPNISRTDTFLDDIDFLYCEYSNEQANIVEKFLSHRKDYLNNASFWLRYDENEQELILFNSDDILMTMVASSGRFVLKRIYDGRSDYQAVEILKRQKKTCLKIKGSKIKLIQRYHLVPDWYSPSSVLDYFSRMQDFYNRILEDLWHNIKELKKEYSIDFDNLADILQYEIKLEENKVGDTVTITTENKIENSFCSYYQSGLAFKFNLAISDYNRLSNAENEDVMYVAMVDEENKILKSGVLLYYDQEEVATIEFPNNRDISASKVKSGFRLKRKISSEHLKIQKDAIKSFIKDKDNSLFARYLTGDFPSPNIENYQSIEFLNENIAKAVVGNNQPLAVQKALGNQGLLLIQGPPGTGKTTVIIEIIRQLVKEGKKVLVCAQAHAAVDNICKKIKEVAEEENSEIQYLSLGNEGETRSWARGFSAEGYKMFIEINKKIITELYNNKYEDKAPVLEYIEKIDYPEYSAERYKQYHKYIVSYFENAVELYENSEQILDRLIENSEKFSSELLEICQYESMDVILGTCIGIGMNRVLRQKSIHFDTVIIDEAAKANLAETLVPLQLGERFVLVGDDRQLPPYLDRNLVDGFVKSISLNDDNRELNKQYCNSLSMSLFEKFNQNINEDCHVMLNYQYRMHPDIGKVISDVFYGGKVDMGKSTSEQIVHIKDPFDEQLLFIDTSSQHNENGYDPYEKGENGVYYNPCESNIISSYVIPALEESGVIDQYTIGIITPYRGQRNLLRKEIQNKTLKNSVYTIDSIQGSEFDIVIFSFVRSFKKSDHKTVGFLDDMRRLNVSLSRAKKKLILIGNLATLTNPDSHQDFYSILEIKPVDVFTGLSARRIQYVEKDMYQLFLDKYDIGDEIECKITKIQKDLVSIEFANDSTQKHRIKLSDFYISQIHEGTNLIVRYESLDDRRKPIFALKSFTTESGVEIVAIQESDIRLLHSEGDRITVMISRIDENTGRVFVLYHNMKGIIDRGSVPSYYSETVEKGDFIKVRIKAYEESRFQVVPVMPSQNCSIAELVRDNEVRTFFSKVICDNEDRTQEYEFEDGSTSTFQLVNWYWLKYIAKERNNNLFFRIDANSNRIMYSSDSEFRKFREQHNESKVYKGTVIAQHRDNYVVYVDGYCGYIDKQVQREFGSELNLTVEDIIEKKNLIIFKSL